MRKPRSYGEVYNDVACDIVNVFRALRDPEAARRLIHLCALTPFAREEFVAAYEPCNDPIERARRTIFRSFAGFGSAAATKGYKTGFRAGSYRSGSTPSRDWSNYPDCMHAFVDRLRDVVVENRPAIDVIRSHDRPETLFYVDPPYVHATRRPAGWRRRSKEYENEMTDEEHERLAVVLRSVQGMVAISGYPSTLYGDLYSGWTRIERGAYADGGRRRVECLWLNPACTSAARPTP